MSKIRTILQLQEHLDEEFSWRIKELANLQLSLKSKPDIFKTLIRAGIPLTYAHWEGFIKKASIGYLDYVNNQRHKYVELSPCFIVFGLKKKLNEFSQSRKSRLNIEIIEFLSSELNNRAQLQIDTAINTESNLSSEVFENLILIF
ncbi:MAG: hypothetical protein HY774_18390 [Acidobacteria bacterium]|nr:hypothetical protein [Acidobacteriota bacterium]